MVAAVASVAAVTAQSVDVVVPVPAGTTNGDLLVAVHASDWGTLASHPVPAGFTALSTSSYDGGSNNLHIAIGYRVASAEPASYTFANTDADAVCAILRVTGHDTTPTIAQVAAAGFALNTTAVAAPSITPNGANDLLLTFYIAEAGFAGATSFTAPAGMTEQVDLQSTSWTTLAIDSLASPSSPSGTKTATFSSASQQGAGGPGAATISIKSAAGASTTPVSASRATSWRVLARATAARATTWNVASSLTSVTASRSTTWKVVGRITASRTTGWSVAVDGRYIQGISANGRYFLDQNGDPILVKGDSPWSIITDASTTQMDLYLDTRGGQGFNLVLTSLLGNVTNGGPSDSGATYDGVLPFVGGDPSVLNGTYWDRVDYFLTKAASVGITVMAYPIDGWAGVTATNGLAGSWSNATAFAYGQAVGARLAAHPNLIWATGGDYANVNGFGADDPRFWNVFLGIADAGADRIKTIQFTFDSTSLSSTYWNSRVQFNFVYVYAIAYAMVEQAYGLTDAGGNNIPALMCETHYEAYDTITDLYLRSQAAWALTSGSPGEFYGSENVWDEPPTTGTLNTTAVSQLSALRAAFEALDGWHLLVPDYASTFVTAGRGTKGTVAGTNEYRSGNTYVTAAVAPDGRLGVAYLPAATSQTITVDQSKMGAGYTARWVDPANGSSVAATPGSTYTKSGANAAGGPDWLLVLEAAPATTTPVSASRSTTWDTLAKVTTARATGWDVLAAVAGTRTTAWDTLRTVAAARATGWDTLAKVAATRATTWNVAGARTTVTATRATSWDTLAKVTAGRTATWQVASNATARDITIAALAATLGYHISPATLAWTILSVQLAPITANAATLGWLALVPTLNPITAQAATLGQWTPLPATLSGWNPLAATI